MTKIATQTQNMTNRALMRRCLRIWGLGTLFCFCLSLISCTNILSEMADKESDDALLYQAQLQTDERDYSGAITSIQAMTTAGRARRDVKTVLASAYAGRCGLDLISLAQKVADQTAGGIKLWPILLDAFKGTPSSGAADCISSETILMEIGVSQLTPDEAVLLAFVEFSKMGAILASTGVDDDDKNGVVDASFDSCTNNAANILDADVRQLGTGITIAVGAISASGAGVADAAISAITTMCSALEAAPYNMTGFCEQYVTTDFDANEVKALRSLLRSNEIGFNTCGGSVSTAPCICL